MCSSDLTQNPCEHLHIHTSLPLSSPHPQCAQAVIPIPAESCAKHHKGGIVQGPTRYAPLPSGSGSSGVRMRSAQPGDKDQAQNLKAQRYPGRRLGKSSRAGTAATVLWLVGLLATLSSLHSALADATNSTVTGTEDDGAPPTHS